MSAKQSLDYSNWVRQEVAGLPSPNRGKTLSEGMPLAKAT